MPLDMLTLLEILHSCPCEEQPALHPAGEGLSLLSGRKRSVVQQLPLPCPPSPKGQRQPHHFPWMVAWWSGPLLCQSSLGETLHPNQGSGYSGVSRKQSLGLPTPWTSEICSPSSGITITDSYEEDSRADFQDLCFLGRRTEAGCRSPIFYSTSPHSRIHLWKSQNPFGTS